MKEVHIQRILVRVTHEGRAMSPMQKNERDMQCEINELKKELRCTRRMRPSPDSEMFSEETDDVTYIAISVKIRIQPIKASETMP